MKRDRVSRADLCTIIFAHDRHLLRRRMFNRGHAKGGRPVQALSMGSKSCRHAPARAELIQQRGRDLLISTSRGVLTRSHRLWQAGIICMQALAPIQDAWPRSQFAAEYQTGFTCAECHAFHRHPVFANLHI